MNDFEPLNTGPGFAGSLLRSAHQDAPEQRVRLAVGASLGLVAAATAIKPATHGSLVSAGARSTAAVKPVVASSIAKWLASSFIIAVIGSGAAIAISQLVFDPAAPASVPRVTVPSKPPPALRTNQRDVAASETLAIPEAPPAEDIADLASQEQRGSRNRTSSANAAQAVATTSVGEEIAWLEPARRSLAAKNGYAALSALDAARPHVSLLRAEAQMLRVEALLLIGRRSEAVRLADSVLKQQPSSPHAAKLRRLLGSR